MFRGMLSIGMVRVVKFGKDTVHAMEVDVTGTKLTVGRFFLNTRKNFTIEITKSMEYEV